MKLLLALTLLIGLGLQTQLSSAAEGKKKTAAKVAKSAPAAPKIQVIDMTGESGKDIVEIAVGSKDHTTLVAAVKAADLVDDLQGPGPYTVFAPTDAAFAKLPKETIPTLLKPENKKTLVSVLEHHTAAPRFTPEILAQQTELDMVDGPKLKIENKNGQIFVDGNEIKVAILAKNGIVYIVDNVILAK
jgi:uncharacterized surface protein with fasciclin (FAS1) repeats